MRFNHTFKLTNENETHREYKCDNVNINIDFISGSALRVAVFNDNAEMLPTFTVNSKIKRNLFLVAALPLTLI